MIQGNINKGKTKKRWPADITKRLRMLYELLKTDIDGTMLYSQQTLAGDGTRKQ